MDKSDAFVTEVDVKIVKGCYANFPHIGGLEDMRDLCSPARIRG